MELALHYPLQIVETDFRLCICDFPWSKLLINHGSIEEIALGLLSVGTVLGGFPIGTLVILVDKIIIESLNHPIAIVLDPLNQHAFIPLLATVLKQ